MSLAFNMVGGGGGGIKLTSLAITTPPAKTTYTQGETFDPAGMVVTATYSNGATLKCTGYSYEPDTALADGTEKITVRYTEGGITLTAEQSISVIHRLTSIEITTPPTKTTYEYKDSFRAAGMVVKATYSDGATAIITGYSVSPTTFTTVGSQNVTISYAERGVTKSTVTAVTVNKKAISTIPSQSGTLTYNGSTRYPSWANYDSEELSVSGTTSAINAGSYTAAFTPKANYCWSDGTTSAKNVTWTIGKASGSLSISPTTMTLDSSTKSASIAVTRAGDGTISAVSSAPSIATVSVSGNAVTVTGVANGSATITVSVAEGTNHTAPPSKTCTVEVNFLKANFADNTWEQIIEACHSGEVPDTWVAGNSKTMTIDGTDYQIDIVGKNHDTYTAGGIAPLTFGLHDCYGTAYPMNSSQTNSTGWDDSKMRTETLAAILAKMPENIRNGIRAVNKLTATSGTSSTIKTASDKLFIFSEVEAYGSTTRSYAGEGKQYDYYKAGNSKVKKLNSAAVWWWLRSPYANSSSFFCVVDTDSSVSSNFAGYSNGVCFGFCF
jgi:hypothetical protein|nr:MAG TPA: Putative endo-beta-N-acetylglucosaminidase surface protein [Caudoviricetes sp.]